MHKELRGRREMSAKTMNGERQSGIDLLKIIMMIWIIMFHMANHSQVNLANAALSPSWAFEAFCKLGGGVSGTAYLL